MPGQQHVRCAHRNPRVGTARCGAAPLAMNVGPWNHKMLFLLQPWNMMHTLIKPSISPFSGYFLFDCGWGAKTPLWESRIYWSDLISSLSNWIVSFVHGQQLISHMELKESSFCLDPLYASEGMIRPSIIMYFPTKTGIMHRAAMLVN